MITPQILQESIKQLNSSKKILVAYSGGLDSHVLLHLASKLTAYDVRAIHIHHGLQKVADDWVIHCESIAHKFGISIETAHLNLTVEKGESVESVARKGRYAAIQISLQPDELLLTAHHQNDQAETFLLQLFRGAGVQGLASMPMMTDFGLGKHLRPLLNQSHQSLVDYANQYKLDFIEDPSNQDTSFDRNYLRSEILPQLRNRWKGIDKTISRSAQIQSEYLALLDEVAEGDFQSVLSHENNTLSIQTLLTLSKTRQKLVIRHWISKSGFAYPSEKKLKHIFQDVVHAGVDAQPLVKWGRAEIRRFQGQLYIMSEWREHDSSEEIIWKTDKPLNIESLGLILRPKQLVIKKDEVIIRFRQGGESIYMPKRGGHISLKNIMLEHNVPPWIRSRIPLVYIDQELVQVLF